MLAAFTWKTSSQLISLKKLKMRTVLLIAKSFCKIHVERSQHGIMAKVEGFNIEVCEFELYSRNYVQFRTYTHEKGMNHFISYDVRLPGRLWHYMSQERWYAIKQRNQTKSTEIHLFYDLSLKKLIY